MSTGEIYALYQEIQADQTGYRYVQQQRPGLSRAQAEKVQQLSLEMVIYKRPLALLRAEDYSLEQVMMACHFRHAEIFYEKQIKGLKIATEISESGFAKNTLEAKALMTLGKKYNHPDWVEFGQEMCQALQRCKIIRHNDSQMIQNQVAKVSDAPRVREQDDSTNATSRVKRDADNGMK